LLAGKADHDYTETFEKLDICDFWLIIIRKPQARFFMGYFRIRVKFLNSINPKLFNSDKHKAENADE